MKTNFLIPMAKAATEDDIEHLELQLGFSLPVALKDLYNSYNGAWMKKGNILYASKEDQMAVNEENILHVSKNNLKFDLGEQ